MVLGREHLYAIAAVAGGWTAAPVPGPFSSLTSAVEDRGLPMAAVRCGAYL